MHIEKSVFIDCPPEKLWTCITEPTLIKRWLEELEEETPDDPANTTGVGARSTMRLREGGKVVTYRCVMTAWDPPRRLAMQLTGGSFAPGMAMDIEYRIAPEGTGSRLTQEVTMPLVGITFKLLAPVMWLASKVNTHRSLRKLAEVAPTLG